MDLNLSPLQKYVNFRRDNFMVCHKQVSQRNKEKGADS